MDPFVSRASELARAEPTALAAIGTQQRWTRAALWAMAEEAAHKLQSLELEPGSIVGLTAPSGPAFLWAWLALRQVGVCVLLLDASMPAAERQRIAQRVGATACWNLEQGWAEPGKTAAPELLGEPKPRLLPGTACLKLSSGSTREPCGIAVTAEQLRTDYEQLEESMGLAKARSSLVVIPLSHSYGFSVLAAPALWRGTTLVFPENGDAAELCARYGVEVLPSVPSWFRAQALLPTSVRWPSCTRLFLSAGAPLAPELAQKWRRTQQRGIHAFYGASECGGICFDRSGEAAERGSVGSAIAGVELEWLELEDGIGRLAVHSRAVAQGYVPAAALSECLTPGRFLTGDLVRLQAGEVFLVGRSDDCINVKGKKVNPREVEQVLAQLPGVAEVAVLGQSLPQGEGEIVRAVIACPSGQLSYQEVLGWCRTRLAAHKLPRSIHFVHELPRTERGKLDRRALLAPNTPEAQP